MKKIKYVFTVAAFLLIPVVLSSCSSWTVLRYHYEYQRENLEAEDFLPSGFASYDSVYYDYDKDINFIFETNTITVKVKYDDFYIPYKHFLEEDYDFLAEPVESDMLEGHYTVPVTEFEYNGFLMRVAAGGEYPKKFGIVGYNDETKEIAYLWYHDPDTDFIAEPDEDKEQAMKNFVDNNFNL